MHSTRRETMEDNPFERSVIASEKIFIDNQEEVDYILLFLFLRLLEGGRSLHFRTSLA